MHTALLWKPLDNNRVQCRLCSHFCIIENGETGKCGVRLNREGTLKTLVYERVAALNMDPVEKKPLFHFYPGTQTLSFATMGCNLSCSFCQNYSLSQPPSLGEEIGGRKITPAQLVEAALKNNASSISYTYSEPTVFFELMLDTARIASAQGLKNIMVSNGYQSPDCLKELGPYMHAANVDLKSFSDPFYQNQCGAKLKPVLNNLKHIRDLGWWLEVTTLIIPNLNDSQAELMNLAGFIADELGADVPWHVSRFHPDFNMRDRGPTPVKTLETAWDIGRRAGLHYVYTGNVHGHQGEHTLCPGCGKTVIERQGFSILSSNLKNGACAACGAKIAGRGLAPYDPDA